MDITVKRSVTWYRDQNFSQMNDESRAEIESLFTNNDEGYDPAAGLQISINLLMIGNAWKDTRLLMLAAKVAQVSASGETLGKPAGKAILRQLLDEISHILREPQFQPVE